MNLTHFQHRILQEMPDLYFGQDRNDYRASVLNWAKEQGCPAHEALYCADIKWNSREVERLLVEIEEGSIEAMRRGVEMLLKDRYIV